LKAIMLNWHISIIFVCRRTETGIAFICPRLLLVLQYGVVHRISEKPDDPD